MTLARANQKSLDIGIVGGSIAGCFAALPHVTLPEMRPVPRTSWPWSEAPPGGR